MRSAEIPEVQTIIDELGAEATTPVEQATVATWQAEFTLDRALIAQERATALGELATGPTRLVEMPDGTIVPEKTVRTEQEAGRELNSGYLDGPR